MSPINSLSRRRILKPGLRQAPATETSRTVQTGGDILRYRLAFNPGRAVKIVRGLRQGLTEADEIGTDFIEFQSGQRI